MRDQVAVIGVGCTKFGDRFETSYEELICEAAFEAYADAGIDPREIEAAYLGTYMPGPSGGKSAVSLGDALRLYDRPITRVENYCATGTDAFRNGCLAIASGTYDVVLVLGAEKLKDRGGRGLPRMGHPLLAKGNSAHGGHRGEGAERTHDRMAVRPIRLLPDHGRRRRGDHLPRRSRQTLPHRLRSGERLRPSGAHGPAVFRSDLRLPRFPFDAEGGAAGVRHGRGNRTRHQFCGSTRLLHVDRNLQHRRSRLLRKGPRRASGGRGADQSAWRYPDQSERRPQIVRPPDRRERRAHDLRVCETAAGSMRRTPGRECQARIGAQRRRSGRRLLRHYSRSELTGLIPFRRILTQRYGLILI